MRVLGLDYGSVRIGVAISDSKRTISNALTTIEYPVRNFQYAIDKLVKLIKQYDDIDEIVVGYPTKINNTYSKTTNDVDEFIGLLRKKINLPIYTQDESYSTQQSFDFLKSVAELKCSQIKKIKDKLSAQIILQRYLNEYKQQTTLEDLKAICLNDFIPIVRDETLSIMINIINDNKYKTVLELGTAYGYSAMALCLNTKIKKLVSIELRPSNFNKAFNYLRNLKQVQLHNMNAFNYEPNEKYDFIFFDACKSHQDQLFEKYKKYLNDNGTIFIDNLYLKKFANKKELTKSQLNLLEKLKNFRN